MHCTHCGALLPESTKFCTSCGERIQVAAETPIQTSAYEESAPAAEPAEEAAPAHIEVNASASAQPLPAFSDQSGSSSQADGAPTFAAPPPSNVLAIAGFVCSLILIPVFPIGILSSLLGLILSLVGLSKSKKLPENKGRGLAVAGTIISIIRLALRLILLVAVIALAIRSAGQAGQNLLTNWPEIMPYNNF